MRSVRWLSRFLAALVVVGGVLATGCTDRVTVFKQKPFFEQPPAGAGDFLGYSDQASKTTVCGDCHVGVQASWIKTKHASAWADLEASGHANDTCRQCHSVNEFGNATTDSGGWTTTKDARYQDVQCESCHGPGLQHVENPDASQPIPSLAVQTDTSNLTNGCAECHNGTHHPFVEQWALSKHAGFINGIAGHAATTEACVGCHTGQGALNRWGVTGPYKEKDASTPMPIVCGVCHDPHGSPNLHQLRFPIETSSIETHLCAQCHNYETSPNGASPYGLTPMAPEAQLLVGTAGYFPPNLDLTQSDSIHGTHGSTGNPTLCTTCHVHAFSTTLKDTEAPFSAVGHTFNALPCMDNGVPSGNLDCAITTTARSFDACTTSGCHGDAAATRSVLISRLVLVKARSDTLKAMLDRIDPNGTAAGGAIDPNDGVLTPAEGALFNYNLANWLEEVNKNNNPGYYPNGFTSQYVSLLGSTVHNPFLLTALLDGSINQLASTYAAASTNPTYLQQIKTEITDIKAKGQVH
jgi:predicted CXXCH cytochrome family protein